MTDETTGQPKQKPKLKHGRVIKLVLTTAAIFFIFVFGVAAIGANSQKNTLKSTYSGSGSNNATIPVDNTAPSSTTTQQPYKVGDTITLGDLAVTLTKVIDPATIANPYEPVDAGNRLVAVEVNLQNTGTGTISDDANSDVTLIGSDSQSYDFDISGDVNECTNFHYGEYTLGSNDSESGCVVFELPDGINPAKVQFAYNSNAGEWQAQ